MCEKADSIRIKGPFTVLGSKAIYQNDWITVREDQVIRPGGHSGIFGFINMGQGASVLPMEENGDIYLAKEYKYGIEAETIEVFSGGLNQNETPLEGAQRELQEELGATAEQWVSLGVVAPLTTIVSNPNHMFLAKRLKFGPRDLDEGEEIEILRLKFEAALAMVMAGEITHSTSCVLILKVAQIFKYDLHRG